MQSEHYLMNCVRKEKIRLMENIMSFQAISEHPICHYLGTCLDFVWICLYVYILNGLYRKFNIQYLNISKTVWFLSEFVLVFKFNTIVHILNCLYSKFNIEYSKLKFNLFLLIYNFSGKVYFDSLIRLVGFVALIKLMLLN